MPHSPKFEEPFRLRPVAPDVSRLYRLEPIGLGTADVEGLDSYFIRLAREHCVSPRELLRSIVIPASKELAGTRFSTFHTRYARTLCGLGPYAQRFSEILNRLTHRDDLHKLTLLPSGKLFSANSGGPTARLKQWCSTCLAHRRVREQPAYRPLSWSIAAYGVCQTHQRKLETRCPRCYAKQAFIPAIPVLDACDRCGAFLGLAVVDDTPTGGLEAWKAVAISNLLKVQTERETSNVDFLERLQELVNRRAGGNRAAFCRTYGLPHFLFKNWFSKRQKPSITQFLRLCFALRVTPHDLLDGTNSLPLPTIDCTFEIGRHRNTHPDEALQKRMRDALQAAITLRSIPSLHSIAKHLNVTRSSFLYWLPRETARYAKIRASRLAKRRREEDMCVAQLVTNAVHSLQQGSEYPSWRKIDGRLKQHGMSLRDLVARTAYRNLRPKNYE